ncbi:MAG: pyridoxine 5'-phosphate synthase [Gammaproteobacteria bacterium]|nr:pyridoxine 5'-phosphate synthase [Gammaproteobacteria bacterium]
MTKLSVNINKIALLRNSRGRNFPDVAVFAARCLELGAHGITLHPRPDQRHARYSDIAVLKTLCSARRAELNIEGYPDDRFVGEVIQAQPAQCTLVPDSPGQLTSDHGWDLRRESVLLARVCAKLQAARIRVSLFVDAGNPHFQIARDLGADRIELYTEPYAETFHTAEHAQVLARFREAAQCAQGYGLGVNAGHDLNLENLRSFVQIPDILEVSIGHALIVESLELGLPTVISRYLNLVKV